MTPHLSSAIRACCLISCLLLHGCFATLTDRAVRHDSADAEIMLAEEAREMRFDPPKDTPPDIASRYHFTYGDSLSIDIFGSQATNRRVIVDPEGKISYLMLRGVVAKDKTVDELRKDLTKKLAVYYQDPIVMVKPMTTAGHRFYVLGEIARQGVFQLDRPMRLLDAIAQSGGVKTGLVAGRSAQTADLERSFLLRDGNYLPVNFDALIKDGDLRYNIQLHPGDLIFFASALTEEIFVLGTVRRPGTFVYQRDLTVLGILTMAGWVSEEAQRGKIVVLRGNLNKPKVFMLDVDDVLAGETKDFRVRPGDIVFVSDRPGQYWRELVFAAIRAFINTFAGRAGDRVADEILGK